MAALRFPLILAGLSLADEDEAIFLKSTRFLHGMARACMGDEIQLHSYSTNNGSGYWETTFAWMTPLEEMSYVVTIIWKEIGCSLEPDMIRYGASLSRPERRHETWKRGTNTCPTKIAQTDEATVDGTPECEIMALAQMLGYERFLKDRVCFVSKDTLRQTLKAIADEYMEHFEAFMLAAILGTGPLMTRSGDDLIAQFKKISMPMVRRMYPQLIANHIVSVQPMKGPSALIYYMRYKYAKKFTWSWLKREMKKHLEKLHSDTVKAVIRWRQSHPGPSWLVRGSDPVETA